MSFAYWIKFLIYLFNEKACCFLQRNEEKKFLTDKCRWCCCYGFTIGRVDDSFFLFSLYIIAFPFIQRKNHVYFEKSFTFNSKWKWRKWSCHYNWCKIFFNREFSRKIICFLKVLRRAGIKLIVSSIEANREPLKCAQETVIVPDISIHEVSTDDIYDVVIVPGGDKGSQAMAKNLAVGNLLQQHYTKGKLIAAICAGRKIEWDKKKCFQFVWIGPQVFQAHKIGVKLATVTAYPECQKQLKEDYNVSWNAELKIFISQFYFQVVDQPIFHSELKTADGQYQMLTSQGPGTAFAFALKIVEILEGSSKVKKIREDMLL